MKISAKEWIIFIVIALVALGIWYKLSYPQFQFVDLKITKQQALQEAESYLAEKGVDTSSYRKSIVFIQDGWADRYLQQTLGFEKEEQFLKEHDYELFYWIIRFFRESEKEEYYVDVSSKSGKIVGFTHLIKDTEARQAKKKDVSKKLAKEFIKDKFGTNFAEYDFHEESTEKLDKRTDYEFSWEKKGVYIPWKKEEDSGGAKLLVGATVSGDEVRDFYKSDLDIPEKFIRYVENQMILGRSIASVFRLVYLSWIAWAIAIVVRRKKGFVVNRSRKWLMVIGALIFVFGIIYFLNDFQSVLFTYPTSSFLLPYVGINFINIMVSFALLSVAVVMVGLAGELLRDEAFPKNKLSSFFHYANSTFWGRSSARLILFGYLFFLIMLGLQSGAFYFGQKYLGVWVERIKFTELSSAYIPFLSAFLIGYKAGFSEEIIYRIFGISWAKRYFKNIFLAMLIPALVWGFSHTQYAIFPVWFRGIEVSLMGLFFAFIFLRYGIIPAIIAHYLFDVFWGVAGYILGNTTPYLFISSVFIMAIPLILAAVCYYRNQREIEKKPEVCLNADQKYNLEILIAYIADRKKDRISKEALQEELVSHGWDQTLVELAIKNVYSIK